MDDSLFRLFEAAIMGDVVALKALRKEDKLILERVYLPPTAETPLHVASLAGHVDFVREMMELMPSFAQELNKDGFAPIHLATAAGHLEVAKELLNKADSDLCLLKDKAGRTALHHAAIKGRIDIIGELLSKCPHQKAIEQVTALNETVLHLTVKNSQFEAFKVLFKVSKKLENHEERVNARDNEGKTVLEIANITNQLQVLGLMGRQSGVQISNMEQHPRQTQGEGNAKHLCIKMKDLIKRCPKHLEYFIKESWGMYFKDKDLLPLMASMIAAATFQAGLNPPSTIWEKGVHLDHKCIKTALTSRQARDPFGLRLCPSLRFYIFMVCNTLAFAASIVLIPFHQNITMVPILIMISLYSLFFAYLISLGSISPDSSFFVFIYIVIGLSTFLLFYEPLKFGLIHLVCKPLKIIRSRITNSRGDASSETRSHA